MQVEVIEKIKSTQKPEKETEKIAAIILECVWLETIALAFCYQQTNEVENH